MMDWSIIGTVVSTMVPLLAGGGWLYHAQNKRIKEANAKLAEVSVEKAKAEAKADEWAIWKEQIEAEREHVRFKDERITQLLALNAEKEDRHQGDLKDWQDRYTEQTKFVRSVQEDREKILKEKIALITEIGELKLELQKKRCDDLPCPFRLPPNVHTQPLPGITREQYFQKREINDTTKMFNTVCAVGS